MSDQDAPTQERIPNSGLGVASLVISLTAGVVVLVDIIVEPITPVILLAGIWGFVGFVLGIAGLFQKGRKKLLAILGMVISAPAILVPVFLLVILAGFPGN